MRANLRIFSGDSTPLLPPAPLVSARFGDLVAALHDAVRRNRTWLTDFEDDEIQVSEDLYDALIAYARMRPGA